MKKSGIFTGALHIKSIIFSVKITSDFDLSSCIACMSNHAYKTEILFHDFDAEFGIFFTHETGFFKNYFVRASD